MVRRTDRPAMTIAVDLGRKTTKQTKQTKSISKICIPNFVCVLTNERYKTYQTGFFILSPESCPRVGTWGYLGAKINFRPTVCPLCYLLLNHWTKFNQIWCVWVTPINGVCKVNFFCPPTLGPLGGVKRSNTIQFQLQSQFQRFLYQTLCVYSQMKDTKHIRRDFNSVAWVMP